MDSRLQKIGRIILIAFATAIIVSVLVFFNRLVFNLKYQEQLQISTWANATSLLASEYTTDDDITIFLLSIIQDNNTIPVIVTDFKDSIIFYRNILNSDSLPHDIIKKQLDNLKQSGLCIDINLEDNNQQHLYYANSTIISLIQYYPFIQITLVTLLIIFAYIIFSRDRKLEQNQVFIGLARETAHQLGTPITALLGWRDLLESEQTVDKDFIATEIGNDITRLQAIANRFSKIGSIPETKETQLIPIIQSVIDYLKNRTPSNINISLNTEPSYQPLATINTTLLSWAIENIIKNSIDAMTNGGNITITVAPYKRNKLYIDITDTGKGMTKRQSRRIFSPGFTTKTRGWGIGLTLTKRIIEQYHHGRVFVKSSQISVGTTIRILLRL